MDKRTIPWQVQADRIINESDTLPGRIFDILMMGTILCNSLLIMADSVEAFHRAYASAIDVLQWVFVLVFTAEYLLRILVVRNRLRYMTSFFGIIDFLAIVPAYLSLFLPGVRLLSIIRTFRLLRLFSIFKLGRYVDESGNLLKALRASRPKITVFLFTILFIIIFVGAMMCIVEGPDRGFANIPESMYWAIVTVSTVGYGDISPQTPLGKVIASLLMIVGYGIIAVPTGIITSELAQVGRNPSAPGTCPHCGSRHQRRDALYCWHCGERL
ncbi:ion transporter [Anaerotalea alkaliphila]|uniref:ion transporter n=1 Tax=Anaerotalea alkaliphila TaxID=2662126 RepID=UPI001FEC4258|nr:ion transporter [Anaerotalea alkaliphila]